jgi:hypothetical protein
MKVKSQKSKVEADNRRATLNFVRRLADEF